MDPVVVYVAVVLNGITLVSPDAVQQDKCEALKRYNPTMMCIEKEPDCGRAGGHPACKGPILDTPPATRTYARKRR